MNGFTRWLLLSTSYYKLFYLVSADYEQTSTVLPPPSSTCKHPESASSQACCTGEGITELLTEVSDTGCTTNSETVIIASVLGILAILISSLLAVFCLRHYKRRSGLLKMSEKDVKNDINPEVQKGENMELVDNAIYEVNETLTERETEQIPINNSEQVSYDLNVYESVT